MPAPAPSGVIVTNPPYGVRLQDQQSLAELYPRLGDALKKKYAGWTAYIFTADLRLPKLIGLSPSRRTPLFNGALECRLFEFRMVAGSMRKKP
jgi:putative N6-adenine-specific DNA methylase